MRRSLTRFIVSLFGAILLCGSAQAVYTAHYVFGDSLSDSGNFNALTGGVVLTAPYWQGRFSNGPVYSELVSTSLGLTANPYWVDGQGTNYAIGGARTTGHVLAPDLNAIASLQGQVGTYLAGHGGVADPNALYTVYMGSNDLFDAIELIANTGDLNAGLSIVSNAATLVGQSLYTLAALGAQTIIVPTVTDLGLTPMVPNTGKALASTLASSFNSIIDNVILSLTSNFTDLRIARPDIYGLLGSAVANPGDYGFTNVSTPCYDGFVLVAGSSVCSNPDETLFWDLMHPTAAGHQFIADAVLSTVPEPQTLLLLSLALGMMLWVRRRAS